MEIVWRALGPFPFGILMDSPSTAVGNLSGEVLVNFHI